MSLGVIEGSELRGRLVETGVGSKDTTTTLSLIANNSTHGDVVGREMLSRKVARWSRKDLGKCVWDLSENLEIDT
jgi:hypothetical protein